MYRIQIPNLTRCNCGATGEIYCVSCQFYNREAQSCTHPQNARAINKHQRISVNDCPLLYQESAADDIKVDMNVAKHQGLVSTVKPWAFGVEKVPYDNTKAEISSKQALKKAALASEAMIEVEDVEKDHLFTLLFSMTCLWAIVGISSFLVPFVTETFFGEVESQWIAFYKFGMAITKTILGITFMAATVRSVCKLLKIQRAKDEATINLMVLTKLAGPIDEPSDEPIPATGKVLSH